LICILGIVFVRYSRYVMVLKWLTLSLFTYVAALFAVEVPWPKAIYGVLVPHINWSSGFLTTIVAILGTTISPYLFFWQAAQEAEDVKAKRQRKPLVKAPWQAVSAFTRIRADTLAGMAFSNLIALSIIITTAATLNKAGIKEISTSAQAAAALKPIAGEFAFIVFAMGIIGTGLLAVPVLAGSAAYALGGAWRWTMGLSKEPHDAVAFYSAVAASGMLGIGLTLSPLDPIKALYWSAVINGVVAVPVMIVIMLMTGEKRVMGKFVIGGWLRWLGWASTAAMTICVGAMMAAWIF
jgi:Mn2+/Fe2+ NRAMP family transporter